MTTKYIQSYATYEVFFTEYIRPICWVNPTIRLNLYRKFHTPCILIFGPNQGQQLTAFKEEISKSKDKKIIFESKKATNSNYPGHPRNTLIVVDKIEDQALPEMP